MDEEAENLYGKNPEPIAIYSPIDQTKSYDRNYFARNWDYLYEELIKPDGRIKKGENVQYNLGKLGRRIYNDGSYFFKQKDPKISAEKHAYEFINAGKREMGMYIKNNLGVFFERNDGESLRKVLLSVPLPIDGEGWYNKIMDSLDEFNKIREVSQDAGKIDGYLQEKMKNQPLWIRKIFNTFGGIPEYSQRAFQSYSAFYQNKLIMATGSSDGKPDKNKLEGILRHALNIGWDEFDDETDGDLYDGDKGDIYERTMMPIYLSLAEGMFDHENRERERDEDYSKQNREQRRTDKRVRW